MNEEEFYIELDEDYFKPTIITVLSGLEAYQYLQDLLEQQARNHFKQLEDNEKRIYGL